jgi:hypothetical protein
LEEALNLSSDRILNDDELWREQSVTSYFKQIYLIQVRCESGFVCKVNAVKVYLSVLVLN